MSIELTEVAALHISQYAAQKADQSFFGIRLSVRRTGCSGLSYVLEFTDTQQEGDMAFESKGIRIIVDPKSYLHVSGTVLDYVREGVQEGFRFNNPNAKSWCGCGESFTI